MLIKHSRFGTQLRKKKQHNNLSRCKDRVALSHLVTAGSLCQAGGVEWWSPLAL